MSTPDPSRRTPAKPTSGPSGTSSGPPLKVTVTCETKGGHPYVLAKEEKGGSGGPAMWKVKDGCDITLVSAKAVSGGTISGQRRTGNGKQIKARYEVTGRGPLVYDLCVETESGTWLAYGGTPKGDVEKLPCIGSVAARPEPPPKIRI